MTFAGLHDRDAAIDALLSVARRETLLLAIASGAIDEEGAAVASARLRWAIGAVRQLLAGLDGDDRVERHAIDLDRVANRAQRWLVSEPPQSLQAVRELVDRIAARRGQRGVGIAAEHATLVDLDLDGLALSRIALHGAILTEVTARGAGCDAADARSTRWLRCRLDASALAMAVFTGSVMEHCDLSRANLEGSSWHRATLSSCKLGRAALIDARLDRAVLSDCDLRAADLSIARSPNVASLVGARFVRCDLRDTRWTGRELGGATFVDCKLFGAHGAPALSGVVIEAPDVSRRGDGSRIGTQSEVVAGWRTRVGAGVAAVSVVSTSPRVQHRR